MGADEGRESIRRRRGIAGGEGEQEERKSRRRGRAGGEREQEERESRRRGRAGTHPPGLGYEAHMLQSCPRQGGLG